MAKIPTAAYALVKMVVDTRIELVTPAMSSHREKAKPLIFNDSKKVDRSVT